MNKIHMCNCTVHSKRFTIFVNQRVHQNVCTFVAFKHLTLSLPGTSVLVPGILLAMPGTSILVLHF